MQIVEEFDGDDQGSDGLRAGVYGIGIQDRYFLMDKVFRAAQGDVLDLDIFRVGLLRGGHGDGNSGRNAAGGATRRSLECEPEGQRNRDHNQGTEQDIQRQRLALFRVRLILQYFLHEVSSRASASARKINQRPTCNRSTSGSGNFTSRMRFCTPAIS